MDARGQRLSIELLERHNFRANRGDEHGHLLNPDVLRVTQREPITIRRRASVREGPP